MQAKQLCLLVLGLAALCCTIPGLFVGMLMAAKIGSILVFPLPSLCMVGIGALCFWKAERL